MNTEDVESIIVNIVRNNILQSKKLTKYNSHFNKEIIFAPFVERPSDSTHSTECCCVVGVISITVVQVVGAAIVCEQRHIRKVWS